MLEAGFANRLVEEYREEEFRQDRGRLVNLTKLVAK